VWLSVVCELNLLSIPQGWPKLTSQIVMAKGAGIH
jgi:hypothetical protein